MEEVTIRCPCCNGRGRVSLTGEYLETYRRLAEAPGEVTGAELGRAMGVQPTAMCNRLSALEQKGLATSRRWGCRRLYRAVQPNGED